MRQHNKARYPHNTLNTYHSLMHSLTILGGNNQWSVAILIMTLNVKARSSHAMVQFRDFFVTHQQKNVVFEGSSAASGRASWSRFCVV
jgi:hypothetical protein